MFCTSVCVQCTRFIQVLTRIDRSTIVLQCSLRAPTLTPKYIPRGISFFASSRHPVLCTEPAYPIGTIRLGPRPNRSVPNRFGPRLLQPIRPMLSLYVNIIDILCALVSRKTLLITSSIGFPVRSTTAKVVHSGSRRAVRNVFVSFFGVGDCANCFFKFWKRMTNWNTISVAHCVIA